MKNLILYCFFVTTVVFSSSGQQPAGNLVPAGNGVGAKYATRDPYVCKSKKEPAKGGPSAEQARQYVLCEPERGERLSGSDLWLMENVTVDVGKGRPFSAGESTHLNMQEVDPTYLVYPIRGSFDKYLCQYVNGREPGGVRFRNCTVWEHPHATGLCYKTTFGDWRCFMTDTQASTTPKAKYAKGPQ